MAGEHLTPRGRALLGKDRKHRISAILKDIWFDCPSTDRILVIAKNMVCAKGMNPAPCLLIIGEGGSGKTALIKRIVLESIKWPGKVASLSMGDNPAGLKFKQLVFHELGLPHDLKHARPSVLPLDLAKIISQRDVRLIIIDEIHAGIKDGRREQDISMEFLKMLAAPPYSLAVMAVGTEEAGQALGFDMQLARRYEVVRLERWTFGNEFRSFLNSWNANIPLALDSKLDTPKISKHILKITKGQMDLVVKAIRWAAIQAIVTGEERITIEMIDRGWENRWYYQANED